MLASTQMDHLLILSGIQPTKFRRLGATFFVANRGTVDPDHILHDFSLGVSDAYQVSLRSRRPFVSSARKQLNNLAELGTPAWPNHKWNTEYYESTSRLHAFISRTNTRNDFA